MQNYNKVGYGNMENRNTKIWLSVIIISATILIDQVIKITTKTNMHYSESIRITNWFHITFIENNGMAFGMQIIPKAIQTISGIIFSCVIIWYLSLLIKAGYKNSYIACVSLIFAGAVGNIIDSIFYGVIFTKSSYTDVASFVSVGNGYADRLYGKVVDMFYFPIFEFDRPAWVPFVGNQHFIFFSPVFNFADAAISCEVIMLLLFYPHCFGNSFSLFKKQKN